MTKTYFHKDLENVKAVCNRIKPKVMIRCITFNHEKYIGEALEGFVSQKADFPFVAIVHDDASTDNTTAIIKEYADKYPDIILPIFEKENLYSKDYPLMKKIMDEAFKLSGAEYIAICEGDDYWIDSYKLQKQVNFLDKNPEIGMCYTSFDIKNEFLGTYRTDIFRNSPEKCPSTYKSPGDFLLKLGYVCPPSWVIRKSVWKTDLPHFLDGSFVRFVDYLATSKVAFLPDVTCVYRQLAESASRSKDYEKIYQRQKNLLESQLKLIERYNLPEDLINKCKENYFRKYLKSFVINCKHKEVREAKKILKNKSMFEDLLILIDTLRFNKFLKLAKNLKNLKS